MKIEGDCALWVEGMRVDFFYYIKSRVRILIQENLSDNGADRITIFCPREETSTRSTGIGRVPTAASSNPN